MRVDRVLLKTEGFQAISDFLKKLHILKVDLSLNLVNWGFREWKALLLTLFSSG